VEKEIREQMIKEIRRYAETTLDVELGNLAADQLLEFFEEILTPSIYNQALLDAKKRVQEGWLRIEDDLYTLEKPKR
jgi:uncharacterized protein (DUF2164 family)